MGPQAEDYIETVLTCEGDFYDPEFHSQLSAFSEKLEEILLEDKKKNLILKKVEPWNSVKVTFNIPKEAAVRLKCLAEEGNKKLQELGILAVQIEGDRVISLRIAGKNNETTELIFRTTNVSLPQSSTASSLFDLPHKTEESQVPKTLERPNKNIAQYLGQKQQSQERTGPNVLDFINQVTRGLPAATPNTDNLAKRPSSSVHARPIGQGYIPDGYPPVPVPPQVSPKYPTPPPSVSAPSSPGTKPQLFPPAQMSHHSNLMSNQAAMNSMVSRLLNNKSTSESSPVLVNLLQDAAVMAAMASGMPGIQNVNKLGLPPVPDGATPVKKRKRRKPKDKDGKETNRKVSKTEKETESAIHNILNQAMAEGSSVQDRVPPVGLEANALPGKTSMHSQPQPSLHLQSLAPSKSTVSIAHSPRSLSNIGPSQRQILNPITGQLELVDDDVISPPGAAGSLSRPMQNLHQITSQARQQNTHKSGIQAVASRKTSPVTTVTHDAMAFNVADSFAFNPKTTESFNMALGFQGRSKSPAMSKVLTTSFPPNVTVSDSQKLFHNKPSSEALAQSNSAIKPVVSNIACSVSNEQSLHLNMSVVSMQTTKVAESITTQMDTSPRISADTVSPVVIVSRSERVELSVNRTGNSATSQTIASDKNAHPPYSGSTENLPSTAAVPAVVVPQQSQELIPRTQSSVIKVVDRQSTSPPTVTTRASNIDNIISQDSQATVANVFNVPSQFESKLDVHPTLHEKSSSIVAVESNVPKESLTSISQTDSKAFSNTSEIKTPIENHVDMETVARTTFEKTASETLNASLNNGTGQTASNVKEVVHREVSVLQNELSNHICDENAKQGSVDSGLGDIKENNGESSCGSSGNDSPGTVMARNVSVNVAQAITDKNLVKLSDKNVLTVGYVLSQEETQLSKLTSKTSLSPKRDLQHSVSLSKTVNSTFTTPQNTGELDPLPKLVKVSSELDPGTNARSKTTQMTEKMNLFNHQLPNTTLNLIGRSDLNPGGTSDGNGAIAVLNGEDSDKKATSAESKARFSNSATLSSHLNHMDTETSADILESHPKSTPASVTVTIELPTSTILAKDPKNVTVSSVTTPLRAKVAANEKEQLINSFSQKDAPVTTTVSAVVQRSLTLPASKISPKSLPCSRTLSTLGENAQLQAAANLVANHSVSGATKTLNPLLLHGHVMGNNLLIDSNVLKSQSGFSQMNGPHSFPSVTSPVSFSKVVGTPTISSPLHTTSNVSPKGSLSIPATDSAKGERPLIGKQRSKTPDAYLPSYRPSERSISEIAKTIPGFVTPSSLTTVAPSVGLILNQLRTSGSSKMHSGMANLGPSPIMSTGLPSFGPSPIMSTGLPYLSTQTSRQVTPPPENQLKSTTAKTLSIAKPVQEQSIGEEVELVMSQTKDIASKKSPKNADKLDRLSSNKRTHFTVAQLLQDAEKIKDANTNIKPNVSSDSTESTKSPSQVNVQATAVLKQMAQKHEAQKETTDLLGAESSSKIHQSFTSNEEDLLIPSGVQMSNFVQNQATSVIKTQTSQVVISHQVSSTQAPNLTITEPGFHQNLTDSVQKVMNVHTPDDCDVETSTGKLSPKIKTVIVSEVQKSPKAKSHIKLNHNKVNNLSEHFVNPSKRVDIVENQVTSEAKGEPIKVKTVVSQSKVSLVKKTENEISENFKSQPVSIQSAVKAIPASEHPKASESVKPDRKVVQEQTLHEHSYSALKSEPQPKQSAILEENIIKNAANVETKQRASDNHNPPLPLTTSMPTKSTSSLGQKTFHKEASKDARQGATITINIPATQVESKVTSVNPLNPYKNLTSNSEKSVSTPDKLSPKTETIPADQSKIKKSEEHVIELKPVIKTVNISAVTTTASSNDPPKTIVISGNISKGDTKETKNFSLDLRSAVTAGSSPKFIKIDMGNGKERRVGHTINIQSNASSKTKSEINTVDLTKVETDLPRNVFSQSVRRPNATVNSEPTEKVSGPSAPVVTRKNAESPVIVNANMNITARRGSSSHAENSTTNKQEIKSNTESTTSAPEIQGPKEVTAQKVRRTSSRHSADVQSNETHEVIRPARIKRRGSRSSNDSKTSSIDGNGRVEDLSPPTKMSTRGRSKTVSESSENTELPQSRRSSGASSRDRSASPSPHVTRSSGRQTRKKAGETNSDQAASDNVKHESVSTPSVEPNQGRATRSSKRKLPTTQEDKEPSKCFDNKRSKTDTSSSEDNSQMDTLKASSRGDSLEPETRSKASQKPKAAKVKSASPATNCDVVGSTEIPGNEDKQFEGGTQKRSTRSTRSQEHCELPNIYATKKKQKTS